MLGRPAIGAAALALALLCGAPQAGAQNAFVPYTTADGARIPGIVILCSTGVGNQVAACGSQDNPLPTLGMPFQRKVDPFILPATTSPQQYRVTQPDGTKSYRAINPCLNADVRVKSVAPTTSPVVTEATIYPGVAKVTSATGTVTATTGTRFMGRYGETLGSTQNPVTGADRIISVMIVPIPGSAIDISGMTCPFELQYGNGG